MSEKRERRGYTFEILLVVLTAGLAGGVSWIVTQTQLTADQNNRLFTARLACFQRFVKDVEQFRSTSFIYFFDVADEILGNEGADSLAKHVAFHDHDGDIRAVTATAGVLFSKSVAAKAQKLTDYLQQTQWETIVQSNDFRTKFLAEHDRDPKAFEITRIIMREIKYDDFLTLTSDLERAMADDVKGTNMGSTAFWPKENR